MTAPEEGELYKRLAPFFENFAFETAHTDRQEKETANEFRPILDEAAKEFPKPTWHLEDLPKIKWWFEKWFGGKLT